jgi:2-amino-4-hydroxy-6-hydroxymethyldihydropteridine diphosphokinase
VALSLGSNLGDRKHYLTEMETHLQSILLPPVDHSVQMETAPLEMALGSAWFLNQVITGHYTGSVESLLDKCRAIEQYLGRTAKGDKLSRTADIDILFFGTDTRETPDLTIPHPGILKRRFCLEGLAQSAPEWIHPVVNRSIHDLWETMTPDVRSQQIRFL